MKTEQEQAWAGDFGDKYNQRAPGNEEANYQFFQRVLGRGGRNIGWKLGSILELGCGTGANLRALKHMFSDSYIRGVEINERAALQAAMSARCAVERGSILNWVPDSQYDLVLLKGVLIHIPPEHLSKAYDTIYRAAKRWILLAEYYNPTPVSVTYRGRDDLLWKRDFAGEMLDRYPLRLVDYGFVYHRDPYPQDDVTYFLMEKKS